MNPSICIIDTTLRDGSHAVRHQFTAAQAAGIAGRLSGAGCRMIEVSHGDGLGGSSCQYGFSGTPELDLIRAAVGAAAAAGLQTAVGCLLIPGVGTVEDLDRAAEAGISFVRVATHCTEADVGIQHLKAAKKRGLMAFGFLMMVHMQEKEELLRQAGLFEQNGADAVYFADSAGALLPEQVTDRIGHLASHLGIPVGFHAHNNLGLAIANSLAARAAGAAYLDATLRGLGAGAGNAPHEVLEAVLQKYGCSSGADLYKLMDAAQETADMLPVNMLIDKYSLTLGYAGVYGSFYLHALRAAERFGLDARDILVELGRMKTVGGQEDMILDVAWRMSRKGEAHD